MTIRRELIEAIRQSNAQEVRRLARLEGELSAEGPALLRWACKIGNASIVKVLVESGAEANVAFDVEGCAAAAIADLTPLATAAANGNIECIDALCDSIFDEWRIDSSKWPEPKWTEGHGLDGLLSAAVHGQVAALRHLLAKGASFGHHKQRALAEAAYAGHASIVLEMIGLGARLNDSEHNALLAAIRGDQPHVVQLLLLAGEDVHREDDLALRTAVSFVKSRTVPGPKNRKGLLFSVPRSQQQMSTASLVEVLIKGGADVHAGDGALVLIAASRSDREVVRLLVTHGADVNAVDQHGCSPVLIALTDRDIDMLWFLLSAGAEVRRDGLKLMIELDGGWSRIDHSSLRFASLLIQAGLNQQLVFGTRIDADEDRELVEHAFSAQLLDYMVGAGARATEESHVLKALKAVERAHSSLMTDERRRLIRKLEADGLPDAADQLAEEEYAEADAAMLESERDQPPQDVQLTIDELDDGLLKAADLGLMHLCQLFVMYGAQNSQQGLLLAVRRGNGQMVESLMAWGADPLVNDFEAIRLGDGLLNPLYGASHIDEDAQAPAVSAMLINAARRSQSYVSMFTPRQAITAAFAKKQRDPRALIALHQHGRLVIAQNCHEYEEMGVLYRYFAYPIY